MKQLLSKLACAVRSHLPIFKQRHSNSNSFIDDDLIPLLPRGTLEPLTHLKHGNSGPSLQEAKRLAISTLHSENRRYLIRAWRRLKKKFDEDRLAMMLVQYTFIPMLHPSKRKQQPKLRSAEFIANCSLARVLISTIDGCMGYLSEPDMLAHMCSQIGRSLLYSIPARVIQSYWDMIALGIMEFITDHIARDEGFVKTTQAWEEFVTIFVSFMRYGYKREQRVFDRALAVASNKF